MILIYFKVVEIERYDKFTHFKFSTNTNGEDLLALREQWKLTFNSRASHNLSHSKLLQEPQSDIWEDKVIRCWPVTRNL